MPLALADYRTNTNNMLATAIDSAKWTTAILDEGLRNALQEFTERGPTAEGSVTAVAGYEQTLTTLTNLYSIERLAWPWESDRNDPADWAVPFRQLSHGVVRFETHDEPIAGDAIRVVYRRLWAINGLDSAASTTVPDVYERTVTTLAAYYACVLRLRQLTENPNLLTAQTDETTTVTSGDRTTTVSSGDRTTTVSSGDRTTTVTSGDRTTTVSSGDRTTSASTAGTVTATTEDANQFPPVDRSVVTVDSTSVTTVEDVPTVTTVEDVPTVTTVEDVPTATTVEDIPTVTTVEDIPTTETSKSIAEEHYANVITLTRALERAMKLYRELADERLARINHNPGAFANPSWSRIGL